MLLPLSVIIAVQLHVYMTVYIRLLCKTTFQSHMKKKKWQPNSNQITDIDQIKFESAKIGETNKISIQIKFTAVTNRCREWCSPNTHTCHTLTNGVIERFTKSNQKDFNERMNEVPTKISLCIYVSVSIQLCSCVYCT